MGFGRKLEPGTLPVYSVGTEKEAKSLIVLACGTNGRGQYIARELVVDQTLENLQLFSDRLDKAHSYLKKHGGCECKCKKIKKGK